MTSPIKDYLGYENARNKRHADLFRELIQIAYGEDQDVLVGHHLTFEKHGDISTENEIPSADTLLFDHEIMGRVFGAFAEQVMVALVKRPCEEREDLLRSFLDGLKTVAA